MAHGTFDAVGTMWTGFPLVINCLVAGGTSIPGWNPPMKYVLGLLLLSHARLDSNREKEKCEQSETEHASTETIHGQTSRVWSLSIQPATPADQ